MATFNPEQQAIYDKLIDLETTLNDNRMDVALVADSLTTLSQQLGYFDQAAADRLMSAVDVLNKSTVDNRKKAVKKVNEAIEAAKTDIINHIDQQSDGLHQHLDAVQASMIPKMWLIILGAALFIVVFWIAGHVSWNYDAKEIVTVGNELTAEGAIKMVNGAPVPITEPKWGVGDMWRHAIAYGALAGSLVLLVIYGVAAFIKRITRRY
jgi:hypothetical protein